MSNIAIVTVTSARASEASFVEVEYKERTRCKLCEHRARPDWRISGSRPRRRLYDFRARSVNAFGYRGPFEYLGGVEIDPFTGEPDDVADLNKEISAGTLFPTWPASLDLDLSYYRVKHNSQTTGGHLVKFINRY